MEQAGEGVETTSEERLMDRLSDYSIGNRFSKINQNLGPIDILFAEIKYNFLLVRKFWGVKEGVMIGLFVAGFFLGTWDFGIGEISGGGDYNRWGILGGEDSGFLHMKDLALILSLLSVICWAGFVVMLWNSYPIMRENMVYLLIGMGFIQFGNIKSHADNPSFPWESGIGGWIWVLVSNLVMLFLSIFVVRRAVVETRDIHVQRKHSHPDPRVIERAWKDHSLVAWSLGIAVWIVVLNISFWSSAHSVAPSPGDLDFSYPLSFLYMFSGILATFLLLWIVWFPEFMLGSTEARIQSSRAREVSGEVFEAKKSEQGRCPVCNQNTTAVQEVTGEISIPCESDDCSGKGVTGSECEKCGDRLPSRVVCANCGSNTPVGSHFGRVEAW
tara:strand:+ start:5271 stop:6428 length:1158 start_codon:yes stop_codon:yes gene_type:complete